MKYIIKALDNGPDIAEPFVPTREAKNAPNPIGAIYITYETTFDIIVVNDANKFTTGFPASPDGNSLSPGCAQCG